MVGGRVTAQLAPVLFVHGLRTSATLWRAQLAELERLGIPTLAIDLPGHGSRMSERFSLEGAHEAIDGAVSSLTASTGSPPYLVGFSLGGYLSIDWLAQNPGRVSGLLAASCGTVPGRVVLEGWRVLARIIHRFPDRGLGLNNLVVRTVVPMPGAADVIAGGVALEVMDDVLRELRRVHPIESLRRIAEPVLFVNGRLDHIRWHAARYLAATTDGTLVTIPGATHMVSVARPRRFTDVLLAGYRSATAGRWSPPQELPGTGGNW